MSTLLFVLSLAGCGTGPVAPSAPSEDLVPSTAPGGVPLSSEIAARLDAALRALPADFVPRTRHRSSDGAPLYTNRLLLETSPYLRQHAHNPVDWHPWGPEAFALARELGRPVLLSIGYSTCHWCHVMEEESFEDLEIARFLNEHYVAIKVDREERPDVDAVYMAAVQALTGRGGWPMTVWLTPDGEPFMGGTYFPARDGDRGARTGFLTALRRMSEAWDERNADVVREAAQLAAQVRANLDGPAGGALPDAAQLDAIVRRLASRYDDANGGLTGAPKFPSHLPIRFLLRQHVRTGDPRALEMAHQTLLAMARGGIRDHLGGGFHRYSTDAAWLVPHFEQMLYDNALLAVAYTEAWQVTGDAELATVAREVLRYLERDMSSPDGAFYSATDADSLVPGTEEREEGWAFTWTPDEIRAVLDEEHADAAIAWYAVEADERAANAVGAGVPPARAKLEGRSILHTPRRPDEVAASLGIPPARLLARVGEAREALYAARAARPPPSRDDKVIAAWNGLAISAFARAAIAFGEPAYAERGARAAEFVLAHLRVDGRLRRTFKDGRAQHDGVLEDHAFLAAACLDLFEATGDRRWLVETLALDALVAAHFEDPAGGFFRTADDAEALLVRERPDYDGAEPSGASVHVRTLYRLAELTGDDAFRARADRHLAAHADLVARGAMDEMLLAVDWRLDRPKEVVIVTPSARTQAEPFLAQLRAAGLRNQVLVVVPEPEVANLASALPLVDGKATRDGQATAYVCEQGVCQLPTTDPATFRHQL